MNKKKTTLKKAALELIFIHYNIYQCLNILSLANIVIKVFLCFLY